MAFSSLFPAFYSLAALRCGRLYTAAVPFLSCILDLVYSSEFAATGTTHPAPAPVTRPLARVNSPTFRPLHVSFSIPSATPTHLTAPLEICTQLVARGHRITIVHMEHHMRSLGSEEERHQSGFRYIVTETRRERRPALRGDDG